MHVNMDGSTMRNKHFFFAAAILICLSAQSHARPQTRTMTEAAADTNGIVTGTVSDGDGKYRFDSLPTSTNYTDGTPYYFVYEKTGYRGRTSTNVLVKPGEPIAYDIALAWIYSLSIRIVAKEGENPEKPVPEARVVLSPKGPGAAYAVGVADAAGWGAISGPL
jgi:hypothetical protein